MNDSTPQQLSLVIDPIITSVDTGMQHGPALKECSNAHPDIDQLIVDLHRAEAFAASVAAHPTHATLSTVERSATLLTRSRAYVECAFARAAAGLRHAFDAGHGKFGPTLAESCTFEKEHSSQQRVRGKRSLFVTLPPISGGAQDADDDDVCMECGSPVVETETYSGCGLCEGCADKMDAQASDIEFVICDRCGNTMPFQSFEATRCSCATTPESILARFAARYAEHGAQKGRNRLELCLKYGRGEHKRKGYIDRDLHGRFYLDYGSGHYRMSQDDIAAITRIDYSNARYRGAQPLWEREG